MSASSIRSFIESGMILAIVFCTIALVELALGQRTNPSNAEAARIIGPRIIDLFRGLSRRTDTPAPPTFCRNCAGPDRTLGLVVTRTLANNIVAPSSGSCRAQPGTSFDCSFGDAGVEISGHWSIGELERVQGEWRVQGEPLAEGNFKLVVSQYSPVDWRGTFLDHSATLRCGAQIASPADAHYTFGVTRTGGSEDTTLTPIVERVARQIADEFFCRQANRVLQNRSLWYTGRLARVSEGMTCA